MWWRTILTCILGMAAIGCFFLLVAMVATAVSYIMTTWGPLYALGFSVVCCLTVLAAFSIFSSFGSYS